jgi:hypothetical protein
MPDHTYTTPPTSPGRLGEIRLRLVRTLQLAAGLAHEAGDKALSQRLFDLSEAQRRLLPAVDPDWRFEHDDERTG